MTYDPKNEKRAQRNETSEMNETSRMSQMNETSQTGPTSGTSEKGRQQYEAGPAGPPQVRELREARGGGELRGAREPVKPVHAPGRPAGPLPGKAPLFPQDESDKLTRRLQEALNTFVDGPRRSVEEAAGVLEEAAARLTKTLAERPRSMRAGGTAPPTGPPAGPPRPARTGRRLPARRPRTCGSPCRATAR